SCCGRPLNFDLCSPPSDFVTPTLWVRMSGCAKRCKRGLVKFAFSLHKLVTGTLTKGKYCNVVGGVCGVSCVCVCVCVCVSLCVCVCVCVWILFVCPFGCVRGRVGMQYLRDALPPP